jgi:hypothetical protein
MKFRYYIRHMAWQTIIMKFTYRGENCTIFDDLSEKYILMFSHKTKKKKKIFVIFKYWPQNFSFIFKIRNN